MSKAMVHSRSSRNSGLVGARGARCVVANVIAAVMSPSGVEVALRINSINCKRRSEKCSAESLSSIFETALAIIDEDHNES